MMMLLVPAGIFMFRNKISAILGPYIPAISPQKISYLGHLITLSTACIYVLPLEFVGLGAFKKTAYMVSMWSATCTMMLNIKANYPLPDMPDTAGLSLTNMAAMKAWMTTTLESSVKPWLQKAMMGVDFHFLFFSLIFLTASPSIAPLAILARRSLWTVCSYCSKNSPDGFVWSKFAPIWEAKLKPKEKEWNSTALLCTGLAMSAIRGFVISGLEASTAQLLMQNYGWTKEAVGIAIGCCFLNALPFKLLHGVFRTKVSLHGWIRLSAWISILGPLLMFPVVTEAGKSIGIWASTTILLANAILFPVLLLGDALTSGVMLQHISPPGNWFDANYFVLYRALCSLVGRGLGPPLARMAVNAGQFDLAMQQFVCALAFYALYEGLFRRFDNQPICC